MTRYERHDADEARAIAAAAAAARKRCGHCGKEKPRAEFGRSHQTRDGLQGWCRSCHRINSALYRATAEYRAWYTEYTARPETRKRRDARRAARANELYRRSLAYGRTPRGRFMRARWIARKRLRQATDPARIARLTALVALYDAELARMDITTRELPARPEQRRAAP